jgi:zinc protease
MVTTQLANAAPVQKLSNGLRYVIREDHTSPVVSLQIWVRCGGVNEAGPTAGVSHFLEHMVFKGTEKLSAGQISQVVESKGGAINAATASETTHYYIDMPSDGFEAAFDVLAESVIRPSFPPVEFEKERKVILEEIKRRNDDPQSDLWDTFLEVVYRETPYRQQVIGSVETIVAMTREMMVEQHRRYYVPSNMVVIVAGDVKAGLAQQKIKEMFGSLPAVSAPALPPLLEPTPDRAEIKSISRSAQQAHVALGFVGPTLDDPRQVTMDVLAAVLGGGHSSRLFQTLRENKQSVWDIGASYITHSGSGVLGVFAECPPEKARSLPNDIYLLLSQADTDGFTAEELERAKAQLRSGWLFSQETYHGQASQWGFYTTLGHPELMGTYLQKLDRVTLQDLSDLLRDTFQNRELSGVILTPSSSKEGG